MESRIYTIKDGDPSPEPWRRYKNIQAEERLCEGCDLGEVEDETPFVSLSLRCDDLKMPLLNEAFAQNPEEFWCTDGDDRLKSLYELFLKLGKNVSGVYPLNLVVYVAILVFCHPFWWMSLCCVSGVWTVCFLLVSCKRPGVWHFSAWHHNKIKTINHVFHSEVNGSSGPPP